MVGNNLKDTQLQQIVDKTILFADKDEDGKISFDEFVAVSREIWFEKFYCILWKKLFNQTDCFLIEANDFFMIYNNMFYFTGGGTHGSSQKDGAWEYLMHAKPRPLCVLVHVRMYIVFSSFLLCVICS